MVQKIIVIVGPTAVGKTDLSLQLAQQVQGEIISGDSMQIYRHLDIGTAKILPEQQQGIQHHLLNIRDVQQSYTVYEFQQAAQQLITEITQRRHVPMVVGGTGFYIKALTQNLQLGGNTSRDQSLKIRQHYEQLLARFGATYLWDLLAQRDRLAAQQIAPTNTRRVIRALEVYDLTGHKFSQQHQQALQQRFLIIGLTADRPSLYQRINHRVDLMVDHGLEQEAYWLYQQKEQVPQAQAAIGYKEWFAYFQGEISRQTAIELIKRNSRRFAKRQLTYFRHQLTVQWYDLLQNPQQVTVVQQVIQHFLEE